MASNQNYKLYAALVVMSDKMLNDLPQDEEFLKRLVERSGFDYTKPPNIDDLGIQYIKGLAKGG